MEEWVKQSLENAARMLREAEVEYQSGVKELNEVLMSKKRAAWNTVRNVEATCPHTEEYIKTTTHDYHNNIDWNTYHCKLCDKYLREV